MAASFTSAEFLNFTRPAQAQKCRQMADEANQLLSMTIDPEIRATYLDLKRQWNMLAEEIERNSEAVVIGR
jgi:hypothetical protein